MSELKPVQIAPETYGIAIDAPRSQIAYLQACFDSYEGLGIVRTRQTEPKVLCIFTTSSMLSDCLNLLRALHDSVPWTPCTLSPGEFLDF